MRTQLTTDSVEAISDILILTTIPEVSEGCSGGATNLLVLVSAPAKCFVAPAMHPFASWPHQPLLWHPLVPTCASSNSRALATLIFHLQVSEDVANPLRMPALISPILRMLMADFFKTNGVGSCCNAFSDASAHLVNLQKVIQDSQQTLRRHQCQCCQCVALFLVNCFLLITACSVAPPESPFQWPAAAPAAAPAQVLLATRPHAPVAAPAQVLLANATPANPTFQFPFGSNSRAKSSCSTRIKCSSRRSSSCNSAISNSRISSKHASCTDVSSCIILSNFSVIRSSNSSCVISSHSTNSSLSCDISSCNVNSSCSIIISKQSHQTVAARVAVAATSSSAVTPTANMPATHIAKLHHLQHPCIRMVWQCQ